MAKAPKKKTKSTSPKARKTAKKSVTPTNKKQDAKVVDVTEKARKVLEKREKHTPAVFKLPNKKNAPVVFSLEEVREVLKNRKTTEEAPKPEKVVKKQPAVKAAPAPVEPEVKMEPRRLGAASLDDILGFSGGAKPKAVEYDEAQVPAKFKKYYHLLMDLRQHVRNEIDLHSKETLKRSSKEDSGDLSSYGQHMADAGTDNFDRDFALSLVSSEQEALQEIEAALKRIFDGTYGVCEVTGEEINAERLEAVPFTRFSVKGRIEHEKQNRKVVQRGGVFLDATAEDGSGFLDEDSED